MTRILLIWQLLFCLILITTTKAKACDVCGCGSSSSFLGILPQFQKKLLGVNYQYTHFTHPETSISNNGLGYVNKDIYQRTEVYTRWYPIEKLQLFAFIPFAMHQRTETEGNSTISGIGDTRLSANYMLINTGDSANMKWKNTLLLGIGIHMPTGKYQQRDIKGLMLPAGMQIGRGAFGYSFQSNYLTRIEKWGVNVDLNYQFYGENERSYQFGSQILSTFSLFRWMVLNQTMLLPSVGLRIENFAKDSNFNIPQMNTGGQAFLGVLGLDFYQKRFLHQCYVQVPISNYGNPLQPASSGRIIIASGYMF